MNLAELIRSTKGDRSYADLEQASDQRVGAKRWQQLATRQLLNFPEPRSVSGIAGALGVGERVVVLACAESLGLAVSESTTTLAALLPPGAGELDEDQIAAVLSVIRVMGRRQQFARTGRAITKAPLSVVPDTVAEQAEPKTPRARRAAKPKHQGENIGTEPPSHT